MSSTTASSSLSPISDRDRARRAFVPVAAASFLVAAFLDLARADSGAEAFSMVALDLVVAVPVYAFVVARGLRQDSAGGRALVLGVIGLLLVLPAFWSGLPMVFGAAAALLGYAGRRAATGSGKATAGMLLGALSVIGYLAIYVTDWITYPGQSWWS